MNLQSHSSISPHPSHHRCRRLPDSCCASSSSMTRSLLSIGTLFLLLSWCQESASALPSSLKIGGLFTPSESQEEMIFKFAVDKINSDASLFPTSTLMPVIENIANNDSFRTDKKVCSLLSSGVLGIFGPLSNPTSMHVQSICDALEIPHLETRPDLQKERNDLSINLFPRPGILSRAFIDLIKAWDWKSFVIVYEDNESVMRLQDLLNAAQSENWKVYLHQFTPGKPFREVFWKIRKTGEKNILLDVQTSVIARVLKHAQQVGMMTENHSYLITSLDVHTVDLEDFRFGRTKISSLNLVDNSSVDYEEWLRISEKNPRIPNPDSVGTKSLLLYDAVKLFSLGLRELDTSQAIEMRTSVNCLNEAPWTHGSSLVNYMRPITFKGITGAVSFDPKGFRNAFVFNVLTTTEQTLEKVGTWSEEKGLQVQENFLSYYSKIAMENKTLIVTTLLNEPYSMLRSTAERKDGNERYEGFCIDLLAEIAKILKFKYTFVIVPDNAYGVRDKETGEWNGLIGEILKGKADIAIVDLTITSKREDAVDFTHPFMYTGISILFKKPTQKVTSLFSFLSPFSMVVWVYVLGAYVGVSVILFVVGRLSPYEWDNPHPCRQDDQVLMNDFSLLNSFWFTTGSLMQQGSDLQPKSMSTRTIAGIWYFFTLITISSYTANLAAFLTVEKTVSPIDSAEALSMQSEIKYGCVKTGSTRSFFQDSTIPTYQRMWNTMMKDETNNFVSSNSEGKERVARGNYAFLMESAAIEYIVERNCNLTQVGSNLDSKGYGIATKKDSPFRTPLSQAILKLQETGTLQALKDRWWKQKRGGGACSDEGKSGQGVNELSLDNVGGVFVVLIGGFTLAVLLAALEFLWRSRKNAQDRTNLCSEMAHDIKFALSCQSSTKAAKKRPEAHNRLTSGFMSQDSDGSGTRCPIPNHQSGFSERSMSDEQHEILMNSAPGAPASVSGPLPASAHHYPGNVIKRSHQLHHQVTGNSEGKSSTTSAHSAPDQALFSNY